MLYELSHPIRWIWELRENCKWCSQTRAHKLSLKTKQHREDDTGAQISSYRLLVSSSEASESDIESSLQKTEAL